MQPHPHHTTTPTFTTLAATACNNFEHFAQHNTQNRYAGRSDYRPAYNRYTRQCSSVQQCTEREARVTCQILPCRPVERTHSSCWVKSRTFWAPTDYKDMREDTTRAENPNPARQSLRLLGRDRYDVQDREKSLVVFCFSSKVETVNTKEACF